MDTLQEGKGYPGKRKEGIKKFDLQLSRDYLRVKKGYVELKRCYLS